MYCPKCKRYVRNKPYIDSVFDEKGNQKFTCRYCGYEFYQQKGKEHEYNGSNEEISTPKNL